MMELGNRSILTTTKPAQVRQSDEMTWTYAVFSLIFFIFGLTFLSAVAYIVYICISGGGWCYKSEPCFG